MEDSNDPQTQSEAPLSLVDESRRRFTKASIAGSGILATLSSQPVLAANSCTKSSILSGNLSRPGGNQQCGCSPGYWGQHLSVWYGVTGYYQPTMIFNATFGRDVFPSSASLGDIAQEAIKPPLASSMAHCCPSNMTGTYSKIRNCSFQAVAAMLNAATFASRYLPAYDTPAKVIAAYQAAIDNAASGDCGAQCEQLSNALDQYNTLYCGYNAAGQPI